MTVPPFPGPAAAIAFVTIGFLLGVLHFRLLEWNARLFVEGRALAIALQGLRAAVLVAALVGLARAGAWPLLLAAAGLLAGRMIVLRRGVSP